MKRKAIGRGIYYTGFTGDNNYEKSNNYPNALFVLSSKVEAIKHVNQYNKKDKGR